jgi:hypothetical protein
MLHSRKAKEFGADLAVRSTCLKVLCTYCGKTENFSSIFLLYRRLLLHCKLTLALQKNIKYGQENKHLPSCAFAVW